MATNQEVYKGFWINEIDGPVVGATLTVSLRTGAYLIAFLALFVHIAGASFWRLASYAIFFKRAHPELRETVRLQQQAVLRNSASAITAIRSFSKVAIRSRSLRQNLPLLFWACLNFIGFLFAGILSAKVTNTRSEVLLSPTHCGQWTAFDPQNTTTISDEEEPGKVILAEAIHTGALRHLYSTSSDFVSVCYDSANTSDSCITFGRRTPTWNSSLSSGCPFGDLCIDNMMFSVESGYITSDLDLGINHSPEDRISLRIALDCAPIKREGYYESYKGDEVSAAFPKSLSLANIAFEFYGGSDAPLKAFDYEAFFYGPGKLLLGSSATFIWSSATLDWSMGVEGESFYADLYVAQYCPVTFPPTYSNDFDPIAQFIVPNRQTSLFFLSTSGLYVGPVTDPWFKINHPFDISIGVDGEKPEEYTLYKRGPVTTTLGCTQRAELCKGDSNVDRSCAAIRPDGYPYTNSSETRPDIAEILNLNKRQSSIARRLQGAYYKADLGLMVSYLGADRLLAYQSAGGPFDAPVPNDQWTLEVNNWFLTMLTTLQLYTTQFVTGWQDERYNTYITPPPPEDMWMCNNQILHRSDYASFNVLGVCVILIVGGLFIGLNTCITRLARLLFNRTDLHKFYHESWDANELLVLQSKAVQSSLGEAASSDSTASFATIHFTADKKEASPNSDAHNADNGFIGAGRHPPKAALQEFQAEFYPHWAGRHSHQASHDAHKADWNLLV